jgi:formate dehydrogenase assembly factor FdhD
MQKRLEAISNDKAVASGRVHELFVGFYANEGVVPGQTLDIAQVKKLRKKTEQEVSLLMSGAKAALAKRQSTNLLFGIASSISRSTAGGCRWPTRKSS